MSDTTVNQGWFTSLANPTRFLSLSGRILPFLSAAAVLTLAVGLYMSFAAPEDYQQGITVRIMFIHVPAAWLAMMCYTVMAISSIGTLVWRHPLADVAAKSALPIGAAFTFLSLLTGSLWGRPMWGTWWVWDARLTSELILLFLYLGIMALDNAIEDRRTAARAAAVLTLIGVVNIPIIHYSVEWWSTLHQGPTVTKFDAPSIHVDMLIPLLVMAIAFTTFYLAAVLARVRSGILAYDRNTSWVRELVGGARGNAHG
ncbi:MAG: heme ABC transporter permease [Hoeflea sp. D1-CHI-28]